MGGGNHESAGKHRSGKTRHGNAYPCTILVEAAWATDHTHSRLGSRLRRVKRRMGKKSGPKAAVAVAHIILTIVWHLLAHGGSYTDLGADYYTRRAQDPEQLAATLRRKIESIGYTVELSPAAQPAEPHHNPSRLRLDAAADRSSPVSWQCLPGRARP